MSTVTLTTLRTLARERADMVGSTFVADSATGIDRWLNEGVAALHEKLVAAYGDEYVESSSNISLVAGTSDYNLPSDFYKLYEVDLDLNGTIRTLKRYTRAERNSYKNANVYGTTWVPKYKLAGSKIRVLPATYTATMTIRYAPQPTPLVNGSDSVTFPNTWEQYAVVYAAIQALMKEESNIAPLRDLFEKWDRQLDDLAEQRDLAMPLQAVDMDVVDELDLL